MSGVSPLQFENQSTKRGKPVVTWFWLTGILLAIVLLGAYWFQTRIPQVVRIAGGPNGGRYAQLAEGIAAELQLRLGVDIEVINTEGSLINLQGLSDGDFEFGLYQSETQSVLDAPRTGDDAAASFVSNLYSEFLLPIGTSRHAELGSSDTMKWACNDRMSGDYVATRWLLNHIGRREDSVDVATVKYVDLNEKLGDKSVDVGILCCGLNAPILQDVLRFGNGELKGIPSVDAFAYKHPSLSRDSIPAGFFQTRPPIPASDFQTVVVQAQLLASLGAPVKLVEEVTRIVSDPAFQRRHGLTKLLKLGDVYAMGRSEFPMHAGAAHIFNPELKPLINPDFVEGTEGLRSFIVSILVAAWLARRGWKQHQIRSQEHRLDRYIRKLLHLEVEQLDVDGEGGPEDSKTLQALLDRVTLLRQEALSEFTAHELSEDRAVDCFVQMCHALSDKINGKLIRHAIFATQIRENSGEQG